MSDKYLEELIASLRMEERDAKLAEGRAGFEGIALIGRKFGAAADELERLKAGLEKMVSPELDWEDGATGVGHQFRLIAWNLLDGKKVL